MLAHRAVLRTEAQLAIWTQLFGSWSQSPADAGEAGSELEGEHAASWDGSDAVASAWIPRASAAAAGR